MNVFEDKANTYRTLIRLKKVDEKNVESELKIFDFFSHCVPKDFCFMVDTSAFNEIIESYLKIATIQAGLNANDTKKVMNELYHVLDEYKAEEILKKCKE